jgi:hypothetical protein
MVKSEPIVKIHVKTSVYARLQFFFVAGWFCTIWRSHMLIGCDWLCFSAHTGCMSTIRLSTSQSSMCNSPLFGSVSLLVQSIELMIDWLEKKGDKKGKIFFLKSLYNKFDLFLFIKI